MLRLKQGGDKRVALKQTTAGFPDLYLKFLGDVDLLSPSDDGGVSKSLQSGECFGVPKNLVLGRQPGFRERTRARE